MKVLIVDDSTHKIDILSNFINKSSPNSQIDTAESITNALDKLSKSTLIYNLIIIDQYLPLRNGDTPLGDGGKNLLAEINRTQRAKIPNYIIGFSQYDDASFNFSKIWTVIRYEADSNDWEKSLSELLYHIKNNNFNKENEKILPTIFVEGLSDKFYIENALDLYFPNKKDKVIVKTQKSAGSNWVINQIVAWSHSMFKDENNEYIKCIGILDKDISGMTAKKNLLTKSFSENQRKTFKCLELKPQYNPEFAKFYRNGVKIEMDIESLFSINILKEAEALDFLENKNPCLIEPATNFNQFELSLNDHLKLLGFENDNLIYLKKVQSIKKNSFRKLIKIDGDDLINFKPLLIDVIAELDI